MYSKTKIKMCGTKNLEDALAAAKLGVDALGFIFADKSPRYLSPEEAGNIISELPPLIFKIGVFVDENLQEIDEIIHFLGLNGIQLHGNEPVDFCQEIARTNPSCAIFKAIRVGEETQPEIFAEYRDVVDGFVLDTYMKGVAGGTGKTFDWSLIEKLKIPKPFLLAGGLNPDNITDAIKQIQPYGVDVNSGVEHAPGVKDHIKLAQIINRVQIADTEKTPK